MSNIKINSNVFLGSPELNRFQDFRESQSSDFIKSITYKSGIVRAEDDYQLNNFKVTASSVSGSIAIDSIATNTAINVDGNRITLPSVADLPIPLSNTYYWVAISYEKSTEEEGTISISSNGQITGVGTKFTETLRGVPNHSSVIRITNSLNAEDYHIVRVLDDENAILSGTGFASESNMKYSVVGTFTPGIVAPESSKLIFEYDSCLVEFIAESTANTKPTLLSDEEGRKFFIARVFYDGSTVTLDDKRSDFWWSESNYKDNHVSVGKDGKIVGVESIKWDAPNTSQDENIIKLGWGFRCEDYTIDPTSRTITLNSGEGGHMRTSSEFISGGFTGFRIYRSDGNYDNIVSSTKGTGSQIILTLDVLDPDNYDSPEKLVITPQTEEIEFFIAGDPSDNYAQIESKHLFAIASGCGEVRVKHPTPNNAYNINITWRYKNNQHYTEWKKLPNSSIGFYDESSFDENGVINSNSIDRNLVPYLGHISNAYIPINPSANHYSLVIGTVAIGDLLEVNKRELNTSLTSIILKSGSSESKQVFTGNNKTLGNDIVISLSHDDANEGNSFVIIFDMDTPIISGGNSIRIEDNATGVSSGSLLYKFSESDFSYCGLDNRRVSFIAYFDEETDSWTLTKTEGDSYAIGDIKMITGFDKLTEFTTAGATAGVGISDRYLGWALCNGNNGTADLSDKFVKGLGASTNDRDTGGNSSFSILEENLPPHKHSSGTIRIDDATGSGHTHATGEYDRMLKHDGNGTATNFDSNDTSGSEPNLQLSIEMPSNSGLHTHPASSFTGETGENNDASGLNSTPILLEPDFIVLGFIQRI